MSWRRLLAWGLALAVAAAATGFALEWQRFGTSQAGAMARTATEVGGQFDAMTTVLARVASAIATDPGAPAALQTGPDGAKALFEVVDRHSRRVVDDLGIAVTVYDQPGSTAVAWAGRPSDIPGERTRGTRAWFVTPAPLGLRLVHVLPIGPADRPVGVVAVEYPLSPAPAGASIARAEYVFDTRVGPASLRMQYEGAGEQPRPHTIVLRAPGGEPLVEASLSADQMARARVVWRQKVAAVVLVVLAVTLLLLIGPSLDKRAVAADDRSLSRRHRGGRGATARGSGGDLRGPALRIQQRLAAACGLVAVRCHSGCLCRGDGVAGSQTADLLERPTVVCRRPIHFRFGLEQVLAGIVVAAIIAAFDRGLRAVLDDASVDLRHFSLHPWSAERLTLLGGILACHLAALWASTLVFTTALARWRIRRPWHFERLIAVVGAAAPAIIVAVIAAARGWPIPAWGMIASSVLCGVAGLLASRSVAWFRHATVAGRILALFIAFLIPSLLLYPSVNFFTERTVRRVIAARYSVEARDHYQTLQERLADARKEIDALPLAEHVRGGAVRDGVPRTESAFFVWKQTALARERLTSAVELYDATGALVSRFALNFPEYTAVTQTGRAAASCQWEVFGEAAPFGSEERRMLHAERSICEGDGAAARVLGAIVVHVVPDYRTLPFITSQSPYFEVFRSGAGAPGEGTTGNEIAVVIYGWGLTPLYASGAVAWPISEELFARIYRSRDPFWTSTGRGNSRWHVFVSNDRSGIYAIGYPALSLFDRLVHLAELTTLAGIAYVLVLVGTAVFTRVSRERPRVGRALLREIRASFYRKLLLAFVLASIIPVLTLAFVIRAYFAGLLLQNVEAVAARAAFVAQRVIEESAALQLRAGQPCRLAHRR